MVICNFCKRKIFKGDKRVRYQEDILDGDIFFDISFHQKCWVDKYNLSLDEKVRDYSKKMMAHTIPKLKNALRERGMVIHDN